MNILGDIRMEARSVAATNAAADATGGLIGPPLKPKGSYDDDGLLIDYRRKCSHPDCDANLTNRTRWERRTLCIEHGREMQREKSQRRRRAEGVPTREEMSVAAAARAAATRAAAAAVPASQTRLALQDRPAPPRTAPGARRTAPTDGIPGLPILPKNLQAALVAWLQAPGETHTEVNLKTAMQDYELKARLRRAIPIEDPGDALTNPDHRSTRSEFIADADHYGA